MADTVRSILKRVARRLLLTRAAEAAAVVGIAAAGVSAVLMAARIIAGPHPRYATALALLPLLTFVLVLPASRRWRHLGAFRRLTERWELSRTLRFVMFAVSAIAAATTVILIFSQWFIYVPHWLIPLILVPAGAAAAAATVAVRGVSLSEAALYIDRHAGFAERLTTALELEGSDVGFAQAVREQAVGVARVGSMHVQYWRRTRVTPGVLALTALACVLLALVTPHAVPGLAFQEQWEQARRQQADELAAKAAELERKAEQLDNPQLRRTADAMKELSKELIWGNEMPPEKAVGQITSAQNELKAAMGRQQALKDAADALKRYKPTEALSRSGVEATQSPESAADELSKAMADGGMSAEERQQLGAALDQAAGAAAGDPRLANALRDAARAADQQNADAFGDAMNQAASAMGETKQQAASGSSQAMGEALNDLERQKQGLATGGGLTREDIEQAIARAGGKEGSGGGAGNQGSGSGGQSGGQQGQSGNGQGSNGSQQASGGNGNGGGQQGSGGQEGQGVGGAGGGQPGGGAVAGGGGSTNLDQPGGPGDQYHGDAYNEGKWAKVYAPNAIESQGQTDRVAGSPNDQGTPVEQAPFYAPAEAGKSYVPYDQAWQAARSRAEQSVSRQRIPARLRKLIQEYYMLEQ